MSGACRLGLNQKPAFVHARTTVESGPHKCASMMRREDGTPRAGLPHGVIEETEVGASGGFLPHVGALAITSWW